MKRLLAPLTVLLLLAGVAAVSQTSPAPRKHKVVFSMNSPEPAWGQVLNNIANMKAAFAGEEVQVEVVCFGKGISLLLKDNKAYEERLQKAAAEGVVFAACKNSMRLRKLTEDDLFKFAQPVDSGAAEVVRKQEAGWSLMKSGE